MAAKDLKTELIETEDKPGDRASIRIVTLEDINYLLMDIQRKMGNLTLDSSRQVSHMVDAILAVLQHVTERNKPK